MLVFSATSFDRSSGSPGMVLLDSLGGLDFSGYTCEDNDDKHNCFVDVEYLVCTENEGTETMTVTSIVLDANDEVTEYITDQGVSLRPGEELCLEEFVTEVPRCEEGQSPAE